MKKQLDPSRNGSGSWLLGLILGLALIPTAEAQPIAQIAAGWSHSCALNGDGMVTCWGDNWFGQLGNGRSGRGADSSVPIPVGHLPEVTQIAVGQYHTCALKNDGTVACWGGNGSGQLGNGSEGWDASSSTPVAVIGLSDVNAITANASHTCALKSDGTVACWGNNDNGQLGDGPPTNSSVPVTVRNLSGVTAVAAGEGHTCALKSDRKVVCWGANWHGQLGDGSTTNRLAPVTVVGLSGVTKISAGWAHTCALKDDRTMACWGYNEYGQIGDGGSGLEADRFTPVAVVGLSDVAAIAAGYEYTCAVQEDGSTTCWGANQTAQLGNGSFGDDAYSSVPIAVSGLDDATTISAGRQHACAPKRDGTAVCWGWNYNGELGNGMAGGSSTPVIVGNLSGATKIGASLGDIESHTCALKNNHTVACWGYNEMGQLGTGTHDRYPHALPVTVSNLNNAADIATGGNHTCALKTNRTVVCWGTNWAGQLGNGTTELSAAPTAVSNLTDATAITASLAHTCALKSDRTVACWGYGATGQLGDGSATDSLTPVAVSNLTNVTAVASGSTHTCALKSNHTVACWGGNDYGQLGDGSAGSTEYRLVPVVVNGLSSVIAIAAGGQHTCALKSDNTVACWGSNGIGQLGNGTTTLSPTPVMVNTLIGATAIAAGYDHTCALKNDGTVTCWGKNWYGQLGLGISDDSPHALPVAVSNLSDVAAIAAGGQHTCALKSGGAVACWGNSGFGQAGISPQYTTPQAVSSEVIFTNGFDT